jgi:hypothetical protein
MEAKERATQTPAMAHRTKALSPWPSFYAIKLHFSFWCSHIFQFLLRSLLLSHIDILHLHLSHLLHPSFLRESYSLLQFPSPFLRQGRRLLQRLTSTRCWLCDLVMSQTLGSLSLRLEFTGRLALQGRGCVGVGAGRHDLHRSGFNNELIYLPQVSYCAQRWRPIRLGANAVRCADDVGGMAGAGLRLNCLGFSTTLLGSSDGMTFTILAV